MNRQFKTVSDVNKEVKSVPSCEVRESNCSLEVLLTESIDTTFDDCRKVSRERIPVEAIPLGRSLGNIDVWQVSNDKWPKVEL